MLKLIKKLLDFNALFIAIVITIFIAVLSFAKIDRVIPQQFLSEDKLFHLIAYFFLTISWLHAYHKNKLFINNTRSVIICCLIYGTVIELLQGLLTSYRTPSYLDILANSIGVVIAYLGFCFFKKKQFF
ncbi:MAG: Uncharacterised protein [Flavobacterium sp. SCGC AAA160-P02]|nr:MAG: Uncharacterised protein [Flavobacterium sp. SCGC AAA160-P02]